MKFYSSEVLYSEQDFAECMRDYIPFMLNELGIADVLNDGSCVDLGCGLGTVIAELQKEYPYIHFIGIDINQGCLDEARNRVLPQTRLLREPLDHTSLENSSVSIAFSHNIYQLCNEKTYPAIANEIYRILRKGGVYFAQERMEEYQAPFLDLGFQPLYNNGWGIVFRK